MFKHQLKVSLRKALRNKVYSVINIAGLTIGIISTLFIFNYVTHELLTDTFTKNTQNTYRVLSTNPRLDYRSSMTALPMGPALKDASPEVVEFARIEYISPSYPVEIQKGETVIKESNFVYADPQIVKILNYDVLMGDIERLENTPFAVAITQSTAKKYFGNKNPVGEYLTLNHNIYEIQNQPMLVAAVIKDFPTNSSVCYDFIANLPEEEKTSNNWGQNCIELLLKLNTPIGAAQVEKLIPEVFQKHTGHETRSRYQLQAYKDIYFHSADVNDLRKKGSFRFILILSAIGLIIVFLIISNYLVLNTALITKYVSDFGIQKTLGAGKKQLKSIIYTDLFFHLIVAVVFSILLSNLFIEKFYEIIDPGKIISFKVNLYLFLLFFIFIVLTAWLTGTVLLRFISGIQTGKILKSGYLSTAKISNIRKSLLVAQMSVFIALILCSILIIKQLNYIKNKDLGFDFHNVVNVFIPEDEEFKQIAVEMDQSPFISSFSNGELLPLKKYNPYEISLSNGTKTESQIITGDDKFINTYNIKLVKGSNLNPILFPKTLDGFYENRDKRVVEVLVNEEFVKRAKISNPEGELLKIGKTRARIVGVVENFNFLSLYQSIKPAIIVYDLPSSLYGYIIKLNSNNYNKGMEMLNSFFNENLPGYPFYPEEYSYKKEYQTEIVLRKMISLFTALAIFISSIGLFGLSFFMSRQRTKEIGIRKVNGAKVSEVMVMLNRDFVKWVAVAFGLAAPIAYYSMNKWLENFAYKTNFSWWIFAIAGIFAMGIALLTVSWQSWRAAAKNPVEALRYE
ncbi:ABC transporter permease [Maribellus maritimus]|uniref:ABC transporter permease n=1 Tax=Maribellus maritimus TaxID=2870838 RepID=UPI001EEB3A66|nr:ABC transporter permease [Maribellus maritimus]MCG6188718.1 ABC transporter permease [Maribellus maritimus]